MYIVWYQNPVGWLFLAVATYKQESILAVISKENKDGHRYWENPLV